MVLRSHLLAAVSFCPYKHSEKEYAEDVIQYLPDYSLLVVDRGFLSAAFLIGVQRRGTNRHWLTRAKSTTKWRVIRDLGPGDDLVEMDVSKAARRKDPTLPHVMQARAICYQVQGHAPQVLLTSLTDHSAFPAEDIVQMYHERWELELGYDEIKTEMLEREECIRSKSPVMVRQELWGVFLAYNIVRLEMERVAREARVAPTSISFVGALHLIRQELLFCSVAKPGAIPRILANLRNSIKRLILPKRRTERVYPRAVKVKMSSYAKKRPAGSAK